MIVPLRAELEKPYVLGVPMQGGRQRQRPVVQRVDVPPVVCGRAAQAPVWSHACPYLFAVRPPQGAIFCAGFSAATLTSA